MGILNSNVWPTTAEQRSLKSKEEKKKLNLMRRISKALSKAVKMPTSPLSPSPDDLSQSAVTSPQTSGVTAMIVKRLNKVKISTAMTTSFTPKDAGDITPLMAVEGANQTFKKEGFPLTSTNASSSAKMMSPFSPQPYIK